MGSVPFQLGILPGFPIVSGRTRSAAARACGPIPDREGACANGAESLRPAPDHRVHDQSDEDLLDAYVRGDREGLRELMTRYREDLMRFLVRFLGSHAAAEDVFQETFLQIHLSAETFDVSRRFKPWLFTIAANKARDHHRRTGRRRTMSLSAPISKSEDRARFVDLLDSGLPTPEEPLTQLERAGLIRAVVDELPDHLREILLLSYFQKLSYAQIADSLEIPLGTVKSRLHAAVAAFARAWKAAREEDDVTKEEGR